LIRFPTIEDVDDDVDDVVDIFLSFLSLRSIYEMILQENEYTINLLLLLLYIMHNSSMKIGLRLPQTDKHRATKENIIHLAKGAENAGFDSLWVLERLIWPINPHDPYPGTSDGKFPDDWQYIFDPLETLTFVAANTEKIALGTSVIDMLFHNPVILARHTIRRKSYMRFWYRLVKRRIPSFQYIIKG
jgi:hypothetical protein